MNKSQFIVVEGPDGVGKSELVKRLSSELGFTPHKTPPKEYRAIRGYFDVDGSSMSRFLFYAAGVCDSSEQIAGMLNRGGVVSDRYLQSLQIYHEILLGKDLSGFVSSLPVVRPDVTFVLNASPEILLERRRKRNQVDSDSRFENDSKFMSEVVNRFSKMNGPGLVYLDTSNVPFERVVDLCLENLGALAC